MASKPSNEATQQSNGPAQSSMIPHFLNTGPGQTIFQDEAKDRSTKAVQQNDPRLQVSASNFVLMQQVQDTESEDVSSIQEHIDKCLHNNQFKLPLPDQLSQQIPREQVTPVFSRPRQMSIQSTGNEALRNLIKAENRRLGRFNSQRTQVNELYARRTSMPIVIPRIASQASQLQDARSTSLPSQVDATRRTSIGQISLGINTAMTMDSSLADIINSIARPINAEQASIPIQHHTRMLKRPHSIKIDDSYLKQQLQLQSTQLQSLNQQLKDSLEQYELLQAQKAQIEVEVLDLFNLKNSLLADIEKAKKQIAQPEPEPLDIEYAPDRVGYFQKRQIESLFGKNAKVNIKDYFLCNHLTNKHHAKNMCVSCYHRKGKSRMATACEHTTKPHYSNGMCQTCYLSHYYQKRKEGKQVNNKRQRLE